MNRNILLGVFVFPERVDWFLEYLETEFSVKKNTVFGFERLDDLSKHLITFKLTIIQDNRINFKDYFPNPIIIHKRGNAIYTLNALNALIEQTTDYDAGNINHSNIIINWDDYQNKLLLYSNNELIISPINRIF
jgi:hypothetical protein